LRSGLVGAWVSGCLTHDFARFATFTIGCAQAFVSTGGAAAAIAGDAQITTQILQGSCSTLSGFTNLAVGDGLANANVHGWAPLQIILNANVSYFKQMRMTVNDYSSSFFSQRSKLA
jgi:hypothetical protein